jgi:hypothetical protein
MSLYDSDNVTTAIGRAFITPNETGLGGEAANVVDGLFAIARAIGWLAAAVRDAPGPGVHDEAIDHLTDAVRRIAYGGIDEPTGLEALGMTINGGRDGDWPSVTGAIREGFEALAEAIRDAAGPTGEPVCELPAGFERARSPAAPCAAARSA